MDIDFVCFCYKVISGEIKFFYVLIHFPISMMNIILHLLNRPMCYVLRDVVVVTR